MLRFQNGLGHDKVYVPGREVGDLGKVIRARKPKRLPVVMTRDEVKAVLANLAGDKRLMRQTAHGNGHVRRRVASDGMSAFESAGHRFFQK